MDALDASDFGLLFARSAQDEDVQDGLLPPVVPMPVMAELPTAVEIHALSHLLKLPMPILASRIFQIGFDVWLKEAKLIRPEEALVDDYRATLGLPRGCDDKPA